MKLLTTNYKLQTKAFTLIEMLIVVGIISALVGLGVVSLSFAQKKSRDTKRKSDLMKIKLALEMYKANYGNYPVVSGGFRGTCPTYNLGGTVTDFGPNGYIPNLAPKYIDRLPRDPKDSQSIKTNPAQCSDGARTCYIYAPNDANFRSPTPGFGNYKDGEEYKILAYCAPEMNISSSDPFNDMLRDGTATGGNQGAMQISSNNNYIVTGW